MKNLTENIKRISEMSRVKITFISKFYFVLIKNNLFIVYLCFLRIKHLMYTYTFRYSLALYFCNNYKSVN